MCELSITLQYFVCPAEQLQILKALWTESKTRTVINRSGQKAGTYYLLPQDPVTLILSKVSCEKNHYFILEMRKLK